MRQKKFEILRFLSEKEILEILKKTTESNHYITSRRYRSYKKEPHPLFIGALVDKQHENGNEFHILLKDLSLIIVNENSFKICTILYPRQNQVKRICKNGLPKTLKCQIHKTNYLTKKYRK